jgi:hypothetical protein
MAASAATVPHIGENAREISYDAFSRVPSETAASSSKRLFGPSGAMDYRVVVVNGTAQTAITVNAATGDDAAAAALARHPGQKVAFVGPATRADGIPALDAETIGA